MKMACESNNNDRIKCLACECWLVKLLLMFIGLKIVKGKVELLQNIIFNPRMSE